MVATDLMDPAEVEPGELDGHGDGIIYRRLDVADQAAWARLAAELRVRYGQVHGLVNNAGLTHRARLLDVEVVDWERMFRVNTTGPLLGIQALAPLMPSGASIVTIGSAAAVTPNYTAAYTASKWAVRGLAKVASLELGPFGIRSTWSTPATSKPRWSPTLRRVPTRAARRQPARHPREAGGRGEPGRVLDQR